MEAAFYMHTIRRVIAVKSSLAQQRGNRNPTVALHGKCVASIKRSICIEAVFSMLRLRLHACYVSIVV